jgi:uncharacterized protein YceH (UPF0502 family)
MIVVPASDAGPPRRREHTAGFHPSSRDEPLVVNVGRRSGQREERWMHLLGGPYDPTPGPSGGLSGTDEYVAAATSKTETTSMADRLAALEDRVARLEEQLGGLRG